MTQSLQEYVDSRGVTMRADPEAGVLRGVKLIGLKSRNGRQYRESTLKAATSLYEGAKVNVNHPKEGPLAPRDYQDRLGEIRQVELRTGEGLFGDLHFNPKHALAEQLVWDAEHNPRNVGFSHNVLARVSREGERTIVDEITKVQSVDLVADPATTDGLYEQTECKQTQESAEPNVRLQGRLAWDALTLEVLALHRPDLLEEVRSQEETRYAQRLEAAEHSAEQLCRRQFIYELFEKHKLSVADSPAFVEALMQMHDETKMECLVAEQVALLRAHSQPLSSALPCSRDQTLSTANVNLSPVRSATDFADALKSGR